MASASSLASNTYTEVFTSRTASSLLLASFLFDDAQHVAFAVADDAAVAGRIVEDGGEYGRAVAAFSRERRGSWSSVSVSSSSMSDAAISTAPSDRPSA